MNDGASFPKLTPAQRIGEAGVTAVKQLVEHELKWRFRRNHEEHDSGIDGYVDIVHVDGTIPGKSFAVQIKTGPSHVAKTSEQGFLLYGKLKHFNYFLNSPVPVILVWVDGSANRAWWVHIQPHAIRMTKTGWSILIPKANSFDASSSPALAALAGSIIDYLPLVRQMNAIRDTACSSERMIIQITKDEVLSNDVSRLQDFFRMFEAAPDVLPDIRNKLTLAVHGYDDDTREVYEIPEVRAWFAKAEDAVLGWSYYLDLESRYSTLKVFLMCICKVESGGESKDGKQRIVLISLTERIAFLKRSFHSLNRFTQRHNIPLSVNKEISHAMSRLVIGDEKTETQQ